MSGLYFGDKETNASGLNRLCRFFLGQDSRERRKQLAAAVRRVIVCGGIIQGSLPPEAALQALEEANGSVIRFSNELRDLNSRRWIDVVVSVYGVLDVVRVCIQASVCCVRLLCTCECVVYVCVKVCVSVSD